MMPVRFYDIQWDTYDEEKGETLDLASLNLPTDCVMSVEDDIDVKEDGAELLSQEHGWLVKGFRFQVPGKCPDCGADLDYQGGEVQDECYVYDVTCTNPDCDWAGKECYNLHFAEQVKR
jgi:hypothetical protein